MNYRDLQNISNLSQQILVEGANEEHNVLNRWPYTSPYLQENDSQVCEGLGGARDQGDYWKREEERNERTNNELKKIKRNQEQRQKEQQAQEFLKKHPKKTQKEQTDLYDIILSHLLDEGYAETPEQAEVIMVNMSEGWRESIIEDVGGNQYTPNPIGNAIKAGAGLAKKVLSNPTVSSTINQTLRGNTSSGGYSTKPGDGKPYKDGPLWDGGGPKTSPKPQTKKQPPMRDEPLW
jgi:hypothetical protein